MTARAYVSIRPDQSTPIRVICHHCGLELLAQRWNEARDTARLHNQRHHEQDHT